MWLTQADVRTSSHLYFLLFFQFPSYVQRMGDNLGVLQYKNKSIEDSSRVFDQMQRNLDLFRSTESDTQQRGILAWRAPPKNRAIVITHKWRI